MKIDISAYAEKVSGELEEQGQASCRVEDGHVFLFTAEKLEELLASALENEGVAMIFVKRDAEA